MNIGKAIKEIRKQQGFSQAELAEQAQLSQTALSQIENGKRPGIQTLKRLCDTLKVPESLLYIMGMEQNDVPEERRALYDQLFPIIRAMVLQFVQTQPSATG